MTVQIRRIGRPWRWIVMDIRSLDLGPIPLGRRIVDHEQQTLWQGQYPQQKCYQSLGN